MEELSEAGVDEEVAKRVSDVVVTGVYIFQDLSKQYEQTQI